MITLERQTIADIVRQNMPDQNKIVNAIYDRIKYLEVHQYLIKHMGINCKIGEGELEFDTSPITIYDTFNKVSELLYHFRVFPSIGSQNASIIIKMSK